MVLKRKLFFRSNDYTIKPNSFTSHSLQKLLFLQRKVLESKTFQSFLLSIHGFGSTNQQFLKALFGFKKNIRVSDLSDFDRQRISFFFEKTLKTFLFGNALMQKSNRHMSFLAKLGPLSYRRRAFGLPVRGQRTHSNAKTFKRYIVKFYRRDRSSIFNKKRTFARTLKPRKVLKRPKLKVHRNK